jgi:hypothetical protein
LNSQYGYQFNAASGPACQQVNHVDVCANNKPGG